MNDLQKEINELKEFILELKNDRAAAKQKEKSEAWTKYVSLTIVVIAVIGAVAAQWSGKYSSRTQMSQIQASDKWAYYQSKSIKQHLDQVALAELLQNTNSANAIVADEIKQIKKDLTKYDQDKTNAMAEATAFENTGKDASVRGGKMGLAVILLSVSISTASICTVTKKKPLWFAAIAMAAFAVYKMIMAWMV
jgi:hypothetical protein